ncbi:ABC transporter ATP-binding protein [bacterium]|nr:MAG: ABC transporter ATP-binding protein [bacterium]
MAIVLDPPESSVREDHPSFRVEGDLRGNGTYGDTSLVVEGGYARRYEGDFLLAEYPLTELSEPRVEDLVDASALVVDTPRGTVELIRSTSRLSLVVAGAERRLKAVLEGKDLPEIEEAVRLCPKCGRPLPENTEVCEACLDRGQTLRRLFGYAKPYKSRLWLNLVLTLLATFAQLAPAKITQVVIDEVLIGKRQGLFLPLIGGLLLAIITTAIVTIARGRNVAWLGREITVAIRHSLFEKLQNLSLSFYDKRNVGSIMSRMTNDTGQLYDVLVDGFPVVLNQIALLIGIPILLFSMNASVAIWAILPIPFILFAVNRFRRRMHRAWSRVHHQWSRMSGALNGILQGERVVKAFNGESREVSRFNGRITALAHSGYVAEASWSSFFPLIIMTMAFGGLIVWYAGGLSVLDGVMTLGQLTAFIGLMGMLQQPLMMLQRVFDWSTRALTAAERVFEVLDTPIDIENASDAVAMPNMEGAVTFKDVHFGYDKAREVLHGVDLEVKPGEMIGLVGHSGAGKSTLINLLLRFYDPTQGHIEMDGVDLRKIDISDFRNQVGVVLQESYLFPGSIRDNIAYGKPDADMKDVLRAAKSANAHDFIVSFPDGYDTYVGERGQRLSGGERQRIAIARAILHNPKVLVLDEATASVDTETERMIQEALERLIENRTVFAIAHRLSTLRNADRLVVIDDGRVAEIGTHEELMGKEDGIFKKLVDMQTEVNRMRENYMPEE